MLRYTALDSMCSCKSTSRSLYFHISLAGLAACSITFNYPACQWTDNACLLALVITGFRGQVIRSWLHCHPVTLLSPQEAYGQEGSPL